MIFCHKTRQKSPILSISPLQYTESAAPETQEASAECSKVRKNPLLFVFQYMFSGIHDTHNIHVRPLYTIIFHSSVFVNTKLEIHRFFGFRSFRISFLLYETGKQKKFSLKVPQVGKVPNTAGLDRQKQKKRSMHQIGTSRRSSDLF